MTGLAGRLGLGARHARLATLLSVLALSVAVALPVVLLSVGGGVSDHELAALEDSGYEITLSAPGTHGIRGAHAVAATIDGLPEVGEASPVLSAPLEMFPPGRGAVPLLAEGVIPGAFLATLPPEERGLFPSPLPLGDPTDLAHYANGTYAGPADRALIVSSPVAEANRLGVGTVVLLSDSDTEVGATNYTVTGIFGVPPSLLGPTGAFAALLPLSDLQVLTGTARNATGTLLDDADTVEVALAGSAQTNPSDVARVAAQIAARYPYYAVGTLAQTVAQEQNAASILSGFYLALSSVGLLVGLIFLALVLVRRVETFRPTIAILRAIGVPPARIAAGFAVQGLSLAAAGAAGGIVLGYLLVRLLAQESTSAVRAAASLAVFDPVLLGALALGVLGLGALASTAATRAALRLDVSEALR